MIAQMRCLDWWWGGGQSEERQLESKVSYNINFLERWECECVREQFRETHVEDQVTNRDEEEENKRLVLIAEILSDKDNQKGVKSDDFGIGVKELPLKDRRPPALTTA